MLTFDEKVMALAAIRVLNFSKAVILMARFKHVPAATMRDLMHTIDSMNYLLDDGVVEVTDAGVLQFVELSCPQQPKMLSKEYFESCKVEKQEAFHEAFAQLKCLGLLRSFKPYVVVRKEPVYGKKKIASTQ